MPTAANTALSTSTGAYDLAPEYAYDLSGRMTQESRTENGATLESVFSYDPLGQLTSFTRSDGQSETYTYDPVGNMTAKTRNGVSTAMRYNAANQLISSVSGTDKITYSYDANGNLTRSENAAGARSYAYNALNLLESFTREDGYTETYSYNANRLLSKIRTSEDLTTTLTWDILYGDGVVISTAQNGETTNYTYGVERISAKTGSTRTEYVYDGRGSVAAEVSYNNAWYTLGGGLARKNVVSKSYSPFGELLTEQTSGFGYNGEYYNAATGMIYLRARFYEPEMNRFGQKDLLRGNMISGTSLNRYLYCQNDPVDYIDPSGQLGILGAAAIIGGVVGGVIGAVQSVRQQKANNNGSVSVGRVVRDTLIGATVGATSAIVATVTATALVATVGTTTITGAAVLTTTQSLGVGVLSAATGGIAARYTNSILNNNFSPEKPPTNPVQEAFNQKAMLADMALGLVGGLVTHAVTGGVYETAASRQYEQDVRASQNGSARGQSVQKPEVSNQTTDGPTEGCAIYSSRNFRENVLRLTGESGVGKQAHHVFPQKFRGFFSSIGLDVDNPYYGSMVETSEHQWFSNEYNMEWESFIYGGGSLPTLEECMAFARELSGKYGFPLYF